jgi:thiosulfate dehydrogenase
MISCMKPTTFATPALLAIAMVCPSVALAAGASAGEQIALKGSSARAPPCSSCHGPEGQGQSAAGFPRLAGMDAKYLARQVAAFAAGTRANPVMSPIAKMLTSSEASSVAAYYAAIPAAKQPGEATTKPAPPEGMRLAVKGDWNIGLPACGQCHGPQGLGVGSSFPPLAGQSSAYLAAQLAAFKAGTRKDDPLALMQGIAKRLGDAQAVAVSEFYAALPVAVRSASKGKP